MLKQENIRLDGLLSDTEFSSNDFYKYLFDNNIAILILLDHPLANTWPIKGHPFHNQIKAICPIFWAIFHSKNGKSLNFDYEIHPMKCFPTLYNSNNYNSEKYPMPIVDNNGSILAGCPRYFVHINKHEYHAKAVNYCSAFGLPEDCYDYDYVKRMIHHLNSFKELTLWSFDNPDYIRNNLSQFPKIKFMKGEFLPKNIFFM